MKKMKHLELVNLTNEYIWKSKKYTKRLEQYKQELIIHIEWMENQIDKTTNPEIIKHYKNNIKARKQEIKQVEIRIIDEKSKTKQYIKYEKEGNIFG